MGYCFSEIKTQNPLEKGASWINMVSAFSAQWFTWWDIQWPRIRSDKIWNYLPCYRWRNYAI